MRNILFAGVALLGLSTIGSAAHAGTWWDGDGCDVDSTSPDAEHKHWRAAGVYSQIEDRGAEVVVLGHHFFRTREACLAAAASAQAKSDSYK
jgi:hypothetical protein